MHTVHIVESARPRARREAGLHSLRCLLAFAYFGLALALPLLAAPRAQAQVTLAVDLEADIPFDKTQSLNKDYLDRDHVRLISGPAVAGRLGYELPVPFLHVVPEVGFHYARYNNAKAYRGFVGGRVGLGLILQFGAYAHVGLGKIEYDGFAPATDTTLNYDGGLYLDFTALPLVDIGVHAGVGRFENRSDRDPLQWLALGAHASLHLP